MQESHTYCLSFLAQDLLLFIHLKWNQEPLIAIVARNLSTRVNV